MALVLSVGVGELARAGRTIECRGARRKRAEHAPTGRPATCPRPASHGLVLGAHARRDVVGPHQRIGPDAASLLPAGGADLVALTVIGSCRPRVTSEPARKRLRRHGLLARSDRAPRVDRLQARKPRRCVVGEPLPNLTRLVARASDVAEVVSAVTFVTPLSEPLAAFSASVPRTRTRLRNVAAGERLRACDLQRAAVVASVDDGRAAVRSTQPGLR